MNKVKLLILLFIAIFSSVASATECVDIGLKIMGDFLPTATKEATTSQLRSTNEPMLRDLASYEGPVTEFAAKRLSNSALSSAEKKQLRQEIKEASQKVQEIRRSYPELANLERGDEGNIVTLISKLEEKGIARQKIREELKLEGLACEIP